MKLITPIHISYIAAICLLFILGSQAYLVYDYFQTTRAGLIRESDTILADAFKMDLALRHNQSSILDKKTPINLNLKSTKPAVEKRTKYDFSNRKDYKNNILGLLDIVMNIQISKTIPINIHQIDSLTGSILKSRDINTKYQLKLLNPQSGKTILCSDTTYNTSGVFQISSKYLTIDIIDDKALQLVLINPFGIVIKRMSLMLLSSLIFTIICLLAFKALYDMLARQKKLLAFKNEFLSTIAHELKRPVASLLFNLDCLSAPAFINNQSKRDLLLSKSINATTELNSTINMIVGLAKLEEGLLTLDLKPINLKEMLEELKFRFISNAVKQIEIETNYQADEEFTITGDAQLLSQCFANLIDNAIKYSGNEVLIIISIIRVGGGIKVSVKDNGLGIPEAKLPVIFDKYTRVHADITKVNGFGIGLNYVKTIVEKHGGTVEVKSEPGKGSEFIVLLTP
jgi:signal transduction histidine kinase